MRDIDYPGHQETQSPIKYKSMCEHDVIFVFPIITGSTVDENFVDFGQHSLFTLIFLSTIYAILSLSALAGNSIVIWIISKRKFRHGKANSLTLGK